jgi:hypothetical protein
LIKAEKMETFKLKKIILSILCVFLLSGCAVPLKSQEMLPQFDFYDSLKSKKFEDNIFVNNVDVAENVGGQTPVTPEEYKITLVSSFRQADLYAPENDAKYFLDAYMSEMNQPVFGFNLTVTSVADYKVFRKSDKKLMFSETISVPCTKGFGDAFDAALRLRLASGCAVGENITHVIKVISKE